MTTAKSDQLDNPKEVLSRYDQRDQSLSRSQYHKAGHSRGHALYEGTSEVRVYGGRPHAYDRAFAELATKERDNVQRRPCVYLIEHVDAEGLAPTAEGMEAVTKASEMLLTLPY